MSKNKIVNILLGISIVYFVFITFSLLIEYRESIWEWKEKITKVEQTSTISKSETESVKQVPTEETAKTSNQSNNRSQSDSQVDLNSLASIQGYLNGRYFTSGDNKTIQYRASENALYMNGVLFAYVSQFNRAETGIGGRKCVTFNAVSPQTQWKWLFGFYPPDMIRDQEGRNYYLK
jgi:hypothetical protein